MKKIILILICSLLIKTTVFVAFTNFTDKNILVSIAKPVLSITEGNQINIDNENLDGVYEFSISNYIENQVNQVILEYEIQIILNNTKIKEIRLTKLDKNEEKEQTLLDMLKTN